VVVTVLRPIKLSGIDWRNPPAELRAEIKSAPHLDDAGLRKAVPWLEFARNFEEEPTLDFRGVALRASNGKVPLAQYAHTHEFRESLSVLTNSWLALKLRQRIREAASPAIIGEHEAALRFARLISRIGAGTYQPAAGRALREALIVFPADWRGNERPGTNLDYHDSPAVVQDIRQSIAKLDSERRLLTRELKSLERVLISASRLNNVRGFLNGKPRPLDDAFYDVLEARLAEADRLLLNNVIGVVRRPTSFADLMDVLDQATEVKGTSANDLCRQIRVFERELREALPKARPVTSRRRPAIRALGWGDLIVVREELRRYEAREISHIENVLAGEKKNREHERTHKVEELVEFEIIADKLSERDLETSDRFELQSEASRAVKTDFSIEAGVNTSGRYGLTKVDTSLDVDLSRSVEEAQRSATQTAREVISKAVERTQERTRELRRRITTETVRELSTHLLDNTVTGTGNNPLAQSGIYLWVEKIQQIQLHHYGKRLMIEFHVPEPGLSIIQASEPPPPDVPQPTPLQIGPNDIDEGNYLCLSELYEATGVEPPPPVILQVGKAFATEVVDSANNVSTETTIAQLVKVPDGYLPSGGRYATTGRGRTESELDAFHAHLSVGGEVALDSAVAMMDAESPEGEISYQGAFELQSPTGTDDQGLPIAVRVSGADDNAATMNVYVTCERGYAAFVAWQIATYQRIKEAHDALVAQHREALARMRFAAETTNTFGGRPSAQNRAMERIELQKWSIKLMRAKPYTFDGVIDEQGVQEVDPAAADEQAPIVRFFEEAFEWDQMSYFLHPYFWGRRASWDPRQRITVSEDPQHEAFLKAGSARVIVPVTPGYEDRVLHYLESDPNRDEWNPDDPKARIRPTALDLASMTAEDVMELQFADLWVELLEEHKPGVLRGAGTLKVTTGDAHVEIGAGGELASARDLGREIYIDGERYEIVTVDDSGGGFQLDRPYEGPTTDAAIFATGSVRYGAPWEVRLPTSLVILRANRDQLDSGS
jgi:hypothetical protein